MNIFFEIHSDNLREGPGATPSTYRALSCLRNLPNVISMCDIGCGPGMQTIDLAKKVQGFITAVDNYQPFLEELNNRAVREKLSHKIHAMNCSMFDLPFENNSFDVIWSEGAIYQMGFEKGLRDWRRFVKRGGYVALSELSWFESERPEEPFRHWSKEYPEMKSVDENLQVIQNCAYKIIDHFHLPDSAWWDNYYRDILRKIPTLEDKYGDDAEAMEIINAEKREMDLFRRYSRYYGYEFYVMKN